MERRQFLILFLSSLVIWTVGNGLVPLLPIYAAGLGAGPGATGLYLSFCYLCLAIGSVAAGWLAERFPRHRLLMVAAGVLNTPVIFLMGRVNALWQLVLCTAWVWMFGGLAAALIAMVTGILAPAQSRGRTFGLLAVTSALGLLIGGLSLGFLVDRFGFPRMFALLAVFNLMYPVSSLFLRDVSARPARVEGVEERHGVMPRSAEAGGLGGVFRLIVAANAVCMIVVFVGNLARSVAMNTLGFTASAIGSTAAASGLVTLPFPALVGWLSDRVGRRPVILASYLCGTAALIVVAFAGRLWHFWAAAALLSVVGFSNNVGLALVTDLLPPGRLGRGLALFRASFWAGGIVGFAAAGLSIREIGLRWAMLTAAILPVVGSILLALTPLPAAGYPELPARRRLSSPK